MASNQAQAATQRQTLADVDKRITDAAKSLGFGGKVQTKELNNGLQVTLLTDRVLFESGQADLQPQGLELLNVIGQVLKSVDNRIDINGYTDDVPVRAGGPFRSNLSLSSFGAQNRRVEIFVQSKLVKQALDQAGLNDRPVTPTTKPISSIDASGGAQPNLKPHLGGN